jgi:hypothetical protein
VPIGERRVFEGPCLLSSVEFLRARAFWQASSSQGAVLFQTTLTLTLNVHDHQISLIAISSLLTITRFNRYSASKT